MTAILIDDEPNCLEVLRLEIERHVPDLRVDATFDRPEEALEYVREHPPDVLFLDVEMPRLSGFKLLQQLGDGVDFAVIFTTAYDDFALKAFRVGAADYLQKPIDPEELQEAVQRIAERRTTSFSKGQINQLLEAIQNQEADGRKKIVLPTANGGEFVRLSEILYCKSDSNYTHIVLHDRKPLLVSRTLKDVEEMLPDSVFLRVHHGYTVNLDRVVRFVRQDGGYLVMDNDDQVPVSRRKRDALFERF